MPCLCLRQTERTIGQRCKCLSAKAALSFEPPTNQGIVGSNSAGRARFVKRLGAGALSRSLFALGLVPGNVSIFGFARLREYHGQFAASPAPGRILYNDLDVPPQAGQAVD